MLKEKTASKAAIIGVAAAMTTSMALAPMAFAEGDIENENGNENIAIMNDNYEDETPLTVEKDVSRTVYVKQKQKSGEKKVYHYISTCSGMQNPNTMSLGEAKAQGYLPCETCASGEDSDDSSENAHSHQPSTENQPSNDVQDSENGNISPQNADNANESAATADAHTFDPTQWTALVPKSHEHYHLYEDCQGLTNADWDKMSYMSVQEAVDQGLPLCKDCQTLFINAGYSLDQLPQKSNAPSSADTEVVDQPKTSTEKSEKTPTISKTADGQTAAIIAAAIAAGIGIVGARRMGRR